MRDLTKAIIDYVDAIRSGDNNGATRGLEHLRTLTVEEIGFSVDTDSERIEGAVLMAVHLYPQLEGAREVSP